MKISLWPSDSCTSITASPSSMPMAMMPPARGLAKADSSVFLIVPLRVPMTMKRVVVELLHGEHRGDLLAGFHLHQVRDRLALAVGADVRDLVDLQPVGAAAIGEDHHVGVRRRHEQVVDDVLFARAHADAALAAAVLRAIRRDRRALDVAGVGDRHRDVFLGDQILDAELALFFDQLRCAADPRTSPSPRAARRG